MSPTTSTLSTTPTMTWSTMYLIPNTASSAETPTPASAAGMIAISEAIRPPVPLLSGSPNAAASGIDSEDATMADTNAPPSS